MLDAEKAAVGDRTPMRTWFHMLVPAWETQSSETLGEGHPTERPQGQNDSLQAHVK